MNEKTSECSKDSNKQAAENEAKGIVETAKEKAAGAYVKWILGMFSNVYFADFSYNYVAEKVTEATHAVTGEDGKGLVETVKEKASDA